MKNSNSWLPSKFVLKNGKLKASIDPNEVAVASRLVADITAGYYDKYLKKYASGKLLDLGCGKAPLYLVYKNYASECICVDWPNSLHKNSYLDFEMDLNNNLEFESEMFNTIILSDVLEHIYNSKKLVNEMHRILKKEGMLILNVPFFYYLHEEPHDFFRYTKFALSTMLEEAGFRIKVLDETGGVIEILIDINSKLVSKLPFVGHLFAKMIQSCAILFLKFKLFKKVSRTTAEKFPLGYFIVAEKM